MKKQLYYIIKLFILLFLNKSYLYYLKGKGENITNHLMTHVNQRRFFDTKCQLTNNVPHHPFSSFSAKKFRPKKLGSFSRWHLSARFDEITLLQKSLRTL
jgi:hypothetical protein